MGKININITIDEEIKAELKRMGLNISYEVNEYLKGFIMAKEARIDDINLDLELKKRDEIMKKQAENQKKLLKIEKNIDFFEKKLENEAIKALENEKKRKESEKHCWKCNNLLTEKDISRGIIGSGLICTNCYLSY